MSTTVWQNQAMAPANGATAAEGERNETLFRLLIEEGFNKGSLDIVDEIIAPGAREHQYFSPNHPDGPDGVKNVIRDLHRLFSDFRLTIQDITIDGDTVWARMIGQGTHSGEFMGRPPTGKEMKITVVDICRFDKGKMVEHWGVPDRFHMMLQLGLLPALQGTPD